MLTDRLSDHVSDAQRDYYFDHDVRLTLDVIMSEDQRPNFGWDVVGTLVHQLWMHLLIAINSMG